MLSELFSIRHRRKRRTRKSYRIGQAAEREKRARDARMIRGEPVPGRRVGTVFRCNPGNRRVESDRKKRKALERAHLLDGLGELALLATEGLDLAVADIGNPLRLAFAEAGDLTDLVHDRIVADAEVDIGKVALRHIVVTVLGEEGLEVLLVEVIARPEVEVHKDAGVRLNAFDVHQDGGNRVLVRLRSILRSELGIDHIAGLQIQGSDVVDIGGLGKIDVRHGNFELKLTGGVPPHLRVGGGGRRGVPSA